MKKLLIVPILALAVATFAPAAYANHGGAQSPDIEQADERCEVAYVFHASCNVTAADPARVSMSARSAGVPTADGWHVSFNITILDNANDQVLRTGHLDNTLPYTANWFGLPDPLVHPNLNLTSGLFTSSGSETTDATCLVDVVVGSGRTVRCSFAGSGPFLLPGHTPL